MSVQKRYSRDFKLSASRLIVDQGYTYIRASKRLGVNAWTLRDWVRKFRSEGVLPPVGESVPEAEEMKMAEPVRLTKEQRLTVDRAVANFKASENAPDLTDGYVVERICADWLAG